MHVLLCPFTERSWGHLVRQLALARALAERGDRVTFACTAAPRETIERAGFAFVELHAMARQDLLRNPTRRGARRWLADELSAARGCIARVAPSIVVTDLQPIFNVAAALDGVPSASLLNLELVRQPLAWWLPALDHLLGELGVPAWAARRVFGDLLVVGDVAASIGLRDLAPELAARITASVCELRFVGPVQTPLDFAREPPARTGRPRVIISFGASVHMRVVAEVLDACAEVDADYLVITAGRTHERLDAAAAAHVARGHAVEIIARADDFAARLAAADALVTHGGHGTLVQALAVGVPLLIVPGTLEQELNVRRVRGLGEITSPDRAVMRATIGHQLATLLAEDRRAALRRAAAELAAYRGRDDAADLVRRLASTATELAAYRGRDDADGLVRRLSTAPPVRDARATVRTLAASVFARTHHTPSLCGVAAAALLAHELGDDAPPGADLAGWRAAIAAGMHDLDASFFDGILGAAWALAVTGGDPCLTGVDEAVVETLRDPWDGGLAPFGGGLVGFGMYGLVRRTTAGRAIVARCVALLAELALRRGRELRWGPQRQGIAVPLANLEGAAAAIALLAGAARHAPRAVDLARRGARTLRADLDRLAGNAVGSDAIGSATSRLAAGLVHGTGAWGLGSAGVLVALVAAARATREPRDRDAALRFARELAALDPAACDAVDASLGAGSAGIASALQSASELAGGRDATLLAGTAHWHLRTLLACAAGPPASFDPLRDVTDRGSQWAHRDGLLEGTTGTALSLLASLRGTRRVPSLARCLFA